ncbi:MAG: NYN domain-containing protein [Candidatus Gracilibacteria bacterium]|jgi:uncharacterized LabA/DUF88 family protein
MPKQKTTNNCAYIDGANLHKGTENLGWDFNYSAFRIWLKDKYQVQKAYLFLGYIPKYKDLYKELRGQGYILILKDVTYGKDGKVKGNCDADIVVKIMTGSYENLFDQAVLVSSDGDYASLISFLMEKKKLRTILSPYGTKKCSILLKRTNAPIAYITDQKSILSQKHRKHEKAPDVHKIT